MITKEKLEELESHSATIYSVAFEQVRPLECGTEWSLDDYENGQDFVDTILGDVAFKDLFESYDDAKFVDDNYCTRTEKFEPPLWDEIKAGVVYKFIQPNGSLVFIYSVMSSDKIYIESLNAIFGSKTVYFEYSKEGYKEAIEYAKKLFLEGKEDE